jgi:DNA-binding NarL/FixJ family response regulator
MLERLTKGLTIKQAARDVGCSYPSGRKHLSNAYAKLGVRTQTQAALAIAESSHRA